MQCVGSHERHSRQIDRKSLEIAQCAISQCRLMRRAKYDARRVIGLERLLPTLRAETPAIAGFQSGKTDFRHRGREVVAARFGKTKERVGHHCADGVTADVFAAGIATAVPVKAGHRLDRAQFKRLAKNIARRQPPAPLLFASVSQHMAAQKIVRWTVADEFRRRPENAEWQGTLKLPEAHAGSDQGGALPD
jgi:hypothetical protein